MDLKHNVNLPGYHHFIQGCSIVRITVFVLVWMAELSSGDRKGNETEAKGERVGVENRGGKRRRREDMRGSLVAGV